MNERPAHLGRLTEPNHSVSSREYLVYKYYLSSLFKAFEVYASGNLLDIGCGNKPFSNKLAAYVESYTGCDIVQSSLNCVDIVCEANNIPISNETFDTVISTQTIEHVADHQGLVVEAFRLLKPGGYFIVSGPMYWPLHEVPYDFFRFTRFGFEYLMKNAGFEVIEIHENGGKWALCGQAIIQSIYPDIYKRKGTRALMVRGFLRAVGGIKTLNRLFSYLDEKYYDAGNTMNYVVVSQKPLV